MICFISVIRNLRHPMRPVIAWGVDVQQSDLCLYAVNNPGGRSTQVPVSETSNHFLSFDHAQHSEIRKCKADSIDRHVGSIIHHGYEPPSHRGSDLPIA